MAEANPRFSNGRIKPSLFKWQKQTLVSQMARASSANQLNVSNQLNLFNQPVTTNCRPQVTIEDCCALHPTQKS
jgi:hypothetical protein